MAAELRRDPLPLRLARTEVGTYSPTSPSHIRRTATLSHNELTRQLNDETTKIKELVMPSVVSIVTYEDVVGPNGQTEQREKAIGSGFMVNGVIWTNRHVTEDSRIDTFERIAVITSSTAPDGSVREAAVFTSAKVLYASPDVDVAFVGIDPHEHPEVVVPDLVIGSSDSIQAGDRIMTFGAPLGLPNTIAVGHVSHDGTYPVEGSETYIAIDAAVRPGNSGGPVANLEDGTIVGVTTARLGEEASAGFMIPIEVFMQEFMKSQVQHEQVTSPSLVN